MATNEIDSIKRLLEQEESLLARKREAVKAAGSSLESMRRAVAASTEALSTLRELGFSQRDVTAAFNLTREEASLVSPRRTRRPSASADDSSDTVDGSVASASTSSRSSAA